MKFCHCVSEIDNILSILKMTKDVLNIARAVII